MGGLASGYYPHLQTLEQTWNSASAELACKTLSAYHPTVIEFSSATGRDPLTPLRVEDFARNLSERARSEACEFIVCYYVGHMFVNAGQQLALLSAGADEQAVARGVGSEKWDRGENGNAFLPLAQLYQALESAGVPFLLLIDGCMESKLVQSRLADGGFLYDPMRPGLMIYQGPNELVVPADVAVITRSQADFGRAEAFLREINPVSFAAKPGTFAVARPNPFVVGGPPVAPLAADLHRWAELFGIRESFPTFKEFMDRIVGFRGVGEIGMEGGISWSDFSRLDAITQRLKTGGYVNSRDATKAVTQRVSIDLGLIEDFSLDSSRTWTLQVKTVESSGRNRWDIWQVPPPSSSVRARPKRIVADILFPKMARSTDALYIYSDQNRELYRWPTGAARKKRLLSDFSVSELAPGFGGRSILALRCDNTLGHGGDTLIRFSGEKSETVMTAELSSATSIVEGATGHLAWLDSDITGSIQLSDSGKLRMVHLGDDELSALTFSANGIVATNKARTKLYRLRSDDAVERAWLLDSEDRPIVHFHAGSGGLHCFGLETWFASDQSLLQIDLARLDWQAVQR